jgi:hypothetical protein
VDISLEMIPIPESISERWGDTNYMQGTNYQEPRVKNAQMHNVVAEPPIMRFAH